MATARAIVNASRCNSCRVAILRSFISIAEAPQHSFPAISQLQRLNVHSGGQRRPFSISRYNQSDRVPSSAALEQDVDTIEEDAQEMDDETTASEPIPWYLQVDTPQRAPQSISDRQKIPELPAAPPPLLQPLLEHISVKLGLDDLTILDLRNLDPPPALGANLLMILGTARSERHLHVSADRLCRWLRSDYKLTPFADGLLGRNELKLKLRRKNRRAKLLGSVGAPERENVDDGMKTGWVCVNLGRVEGDPNATPVVAETKGFVGFGGDAQGVRLVVQMLTEEKRDELDLEGLWGKLLDQKARRDAKTVELAERAAATNSAESVDEAAEETISGSATVQVHRAQSSKGSFQTPQARGFHTSATHFVRQSFRTSLTDVQKSRLHSASSSSSPQIEERIASSKRKESNLMSEVESEGYRYVHRRVRNLQRVLLESYAADGRRELILQALLNHLRSVPSEDALQLLGSGHADRISNGFLFSFYRNIPAFAESYHWHCVLELHSSAIELGHPGYTKDALFQQLTNMRASGVEVPENTLMMVFKAIVNTTLTPNSSEDYDMAVDVLEDMQRRGYDISTEEIFLVLLQAVHPRKIADIAGEKAFNEEDTSQNPGVSYDAEKLRQRRLDKLIDMFDIPMVGVNGILTTLQLYHDRNDMDSFWRLWHNIPLRAIRRTEEYYAYMFQCIAKMKHQKTAIEALREWVPEMSREEPMVEWTKEVAVAISQCVTIAHPRVLQDVTNETEVSNEWSRLWNRCLTSLKTEVLQETMKRVEENQKKSRDQVNDRTHGFGSLVRSNFRWTASPLSLEDKELVRKAQSSRTNPGEMWERIVKLNMELPEVILPKKSIQRRKEEIKPRRQMNS